MSETKKIDDKKYHVKVTAQSFFLPDQSDEDNDQYVFAYTIHIENVGQVSEIGRAHV